MHDALGGVRRSRVTRLDGRPHPCATSVVSERHERFRGVRTCNGTCTVFIPVFRAHRPRSPCARAASRARGVARRSAFKTSSNLPPSAFGSADRASSLRPRVQPARSTRGVRPRVVRVVTSRFGVVRPSGFGFKVYARLVLKSVSCRWCRSVSAFFGFRYASDIRRRSDIRRVFGYRFDSDIRRLETQNPNRRPVRTNSLKCPSRRIPKTKK